MKPAVLRPAALRDQSGQVRYYRKEAGAVLASRVAKATNFALDQIERDPGIGSPLLHLDVVRLLGERQDIATILGAGFAAT